MSDQIDEGSIRRLQEELQKIYPELAKLTKSVAKTTKAVDDENHQINKFTRGIDQYNDEMAKANRAIGGFSQSLENGVRDIAKFALAPMGKAGFIATAALTTLWKSASSVNETWREMTKHGQTFNGSMFEMQKAAWDAGMPLKDFAQIQSRHNITINATGKQFWAINKQLRENSRVSGLYGMSVTEMTEFTASYAETLRRTGALQGRTTNNLTKEMDSLIVTTTALAQASDKTREQILELANSAMRSSAAYTGLALLPKDIKGAATKAIAEATAGFASAGGEAGQLLSGFFADSIGIMSVNTQQAQPFIDVGMSDVVMKMQETADLFKANRGTDADRIEAHNYVFDRFQQMLPHLQNQMQGGNAAAAQLVQQLQGMQRISASSEAKAKAAVKNTESVTALMASMTDIVNGIKTAFGSGFAEAFSKAFGTPITELANSKVIQTITDHMRAFGGHLGTFMGTVLTESNINKFIEFSKMFLDGLAGFIGAMLNAAPVWGMILATGTFVAQIFGVIGDVLGMLNESVVKLIAAVAGGVIAFGLVKKMFGAFTGVTNITAGVVNVKGAAGGVLDDLAGGGGRKKGWKARLGAAMDFGKGSGKIAGRLGGVGLAVGAGMGIHELATQEEPVTGKDVARVSAGTVGMGAGMAIGTMLGGPIGTMIGGIAGQALGEYVGNTFFAKDDVAEKKAEPKPIAQPEAKAVTSSSAKEIADTNLELPPAQAKSQEAIAKELQGVRSVFEAGMATQTKLLEASNRHLRGIDVSTQGI